MSDKRNVLFVCDQNRYRSPTAEALYSRNSELNVRSAGVGTTAETPVSEELLEWADICFVMERVHRNKIRKRYPRLYESKRIVCLYIPDEYDRMDPALLYILEEALAQYLGPPAERPE